MSPSKLQNMNTKSKLHLEICFLESGPPQIRYKSTFSMVLVRLIKETASRVTRFFSRTFSSYFPEFEGFGGPTQVTIAILPIVANAVSTIL